MRMIDFRSDTVTKPTESMRIAMRDADVGDDVYGDDPSINRLEELAANTLGKEKSIFVPSGTMGNQTSIMAHTRPGDEIIVGAKSHIVCYEAGGAARLSGVSCALVDNSDTKIYSNDIARLVRPTGDSHLPISRLVCMENALANGDVVTIEEMKNVYETAKNYGLAVHLDGARIFNAAHSLGVSVKDIAQYTDTLMFCVSKGLGAPVGSLVCGSEEFIAEVHRCRKLLGGGLRQAGVLAVCGIIAIEEMSKTLGTDNENAQYLGELLEKIPQITVYKERIKINMVFWRPVDDSFSSDSFVSFMNKKGIKVNGIAGGQYRFVTHNGVTRDDVETLVKELKDFIG